jgi:hypothetical protein
MREAVESPTCPHFVTGSAMSMLSKEILGRGSLFGRPIEGMTPFWGAQLALKAAVHYQADLSETMSSVIAQRCGGNPFYITSVIRQAAKQGKSLSDETVLNAILAVDVTSGFIWGELNDQVNRWMERINEYGVTKWVLYLSALEDGEEIHPERIQKELFERDGKRVPVSTIRDILIKLSRGDLLQHMELGGWFKKIDDPILLDFLKVWGKIEIERQPTGYVQKNLLDEYETLKRRIRDHTGYVGEIYMAQILWNSQNKVLPGKFFHSPEDIEIPWHFNYIWHRTRLGAGKNRELDIEAAAFSEMWIGESKWRKGKKAGARDVNALLEKADLIREREGKRLKLLRVWFFSHDGFTKEAETLMKKKGLLWSDREDLNGLLAVAGLKNLPEIE